MGGAHTFMRGKQQRDAADTGQEGVTETAGGSGSRAEELGFPGGKELPGGAAEASPPPSSCGALGSPRWKELPRGLTSIYFYLYPIPEAVETRLKKSCHFKVWEPIFINGSLQRCSQALMTWGMCGVTSPQPPCGRAAP